MRRKFLAIVAVFMWSATSFAEIQTRPIPFVRGLVSGEEFLKLNENERVSYVAGVIDGFLASPVFGAQEKFYNWLGPCLNGKTNTQIAALAVKRLRGNPEQWSQDASLVVVSTLVVLCEK